MLTDVTLTDTDGRSLLSAFWSMLKECEASADYRADVTLRIQVEGGFLLWNRLTGQKLQPAWQLRAPQPQPQSPPSHTRLLGGCPACGSQSCVARSCQRPADYLSYFHDKTKA